MLQFILPGHSLSSREIKARAEAGSEALNTVEEELLSYWLVVILSQPFDVTQDHLPQIVTALGGLDHSTAINNQKGVPADIATVQSDMGNLSIEIPSS